jgi:hypothetical protein
MDTVLLGHCWVAVQLSNSSGVQVLGRPDRRPWVWVTSSRTSCRMVSCCFTSCVLKCYSCLPSRPVIVMFRTWREFSRGLFLLFHCIDRLYWVLCTKVRYVWWYDRNNAGKRCSCSVHRLFLLYVFPILIWPTLLYVYYIVTLYLCFIGLYRICSPQESTARRSVAQTVSGEIKVRAPGCYI